MIRNCEYFIGHKCLHAVMSVQFLVSQAGRETKISCVVCFPMLAAAFYVLYNILKHSRR